MSVTLAFTVPVADFFAVGAIGLLAFNGFRRGAVGALFGLLRIYFSFIITAISYERMALLFQARLGATSSTSQTFCFAIIFLLLLAATWAAEMILRRKISESPQTGERPSRIGGIILGLLQGILILSIIYMNIDFFPVSDEDSSSHLEHAFSHKLMKHVAPDIKNFTLSPVSHLKNIFGESKPDAPEESPL